jgi:hypothetical protein
MPYVENDCRSGMTSFFCWGLFLRTPLISGNQIIALLRTQLHPMPPYIQGASSDRRRIVLGRCFAAERSDRALAPAKNRGWSGLPRRPNHGGDWSTARPYVLRTTSTNEDALGIFKYDPRSCSANSPTRAWCTPRLQEVIADRWSGFDHESCSLQNALKSLAT